MVIVPKNKNTTAQQPNTFCQTPLLPHDDACRFHRPPSSLAAPQWPR